MSLEKGKEKKVNYEYEARRSSSASCFKEIRQVKYVCGVGA